MAASRRRQTPSWLTFSPAHRRCTRSRPSSRRSPRGTFGQGPKTLYSGPFAQASAEDQAPAREPVQGDRLMRELPRLPARHRRDHGAEVKLGPLGDHGQDRPGSAVHRPALDDDDVVVEKEAVPAGLLAFQRQVDERAAGRRSRSSRRTRRWQGVVVSATTALFIRARPAAAMRVAGRVPRRR